MFRRFTSLLGLVTSAVLLCSSAAHAQVKDAFAEAFVKFATAARGSFGDEAPALMSGLDEMAAGLQQWEGMIARMESGMAAEIAAAPPQTAARMRAALGAAYLERGRLDDALSQFDAAVKLDSRFAEVQVLRGVTANVANRRAVSTEAYQQAWRLQPQSPVSAYLAFQAARGANDTSLADSALKTLVDALERGSESAVSPVAFLATTLLDEGSLASPMFVPALYSEGMVLVSKSQYEAAIAHLREAAAADSLVTDRALQSEEVTSAATEMRRQNGAAAVGLLTTAAKRYPQSSEVHRLLGMAYWMERRHENGLAELKLAVQLNPRDERARVAIADVMSEMGNAAGARESLHELTTILPRSGEAHWKLGRMHQVFTDDPNALKSFGSAAALPCVAGSSYIFAGIGRSHHNQLNLEEAVIAYSRRIELNPNSVDAHIDLGEVYRAQDQLDASLSEFSMAALLDPSNAKALVAAAQVHSARDRDDAALRLLRKAVALDPSHLEARYAFSRTLLRLGFADEARKELEAFEQLQSRAMHEQRRRYEENQSKIDEALKRSDGAEPRR